MGQPSFQASNAIIYLTYGVFLVSGLLIAYRWRNQSKSQFLASNRTQKAFPLALNFIASGPRLGSTASSRSAMLVELPTLHSGHDQRRVWPTLDAASLRALSTARRLLVRPQSLRIERTGPARGAKLRLYRHHSIKLMLADVRFDPALGSGILFSYPQISTIAGVQGLVVYTLSSSLPLLVFGFLGPIIRRKCPEGFVLTEWARQRYGVAAALLLSFYTLVNLFLYMVAELSALQQIVNALTGLDALPVVIIEGVVTTVYTSLGGFRISFLTDNLQGAMVLGLIVLAVIAIGVETKIDPNLVQSSGLLDASLLGWQLIYIFPVAVLTNDFFLSGFWMRTFASKTDRDLRIGVSVATVAVTIILLLVGVTGLLAAWTGAWPGNPAQDGSIAFFLLLEQLPNWTVGVVLVMTVTLSTAAFDSLQSAMVSTGSNDIFRNKLNVWVIRASVALVVIPVIVVALRSPSILQIYLISDLVSAAAIPVLVLGLSEKFYWWRGFEFVVGSLGGFFTIFLFGTVYYQDAQQGASLLLLEGGLYAGDWSVFGAFVAAPVGALLWGFGALALRLAVQWMICRFKGRRFDALDRPMTTDHDRDAGNASPTHDGDVKMSDTKGRFF